MGKSPVFPQGSPKGNYDKGDSFTILKRAPKDALVPPSPTIPELSTLSSPLVCPNPSKNLQLGIAPKDRGDITTGGDVSLFPVAAKNHSDQQQLGRGKPLFELYLQATVHH